jgi:hypothetical protein
MEDGVAFRVLAGLAAICGLAAIVLLLGHAFSYVIAAALAVVFAVGAVMARILAAVKPRNG